MNKKIVIITNGNYFSKLISEPLIKRDNKEIVGVLIITGDYKARTGLSSLLHVGRLTAFPYLIFKIASILVFSIAQWIFPKKAFNVANLVKSYSIPIKKVASVNSKESLAWVKSLDPEIIVSVSCPQFIRQKLLSLAHYGGVNIHSSLLPTFAGLAPYYWVLSAGEEITGTTVHIITSKFDEGNILVQKQIEIEIGESSFQLFKRLSIEGGHALIEAVDARLDGSEGTKQDLKRYSYYSHPNFQSYKKLKENGHCLVRLTELIDTIKFEVLNSKEIIENEIMSDSFNN